MNENQDCMEKTHYHPEAITHKNKFTGVAQYVNMQHNIMDDGCRKRYTSQKLIKATPQR
jgi:hypothetical protein